jgi:hypothetical protein
MKLICLFRRRPDLTPEQFRDHYEANHAPMSLRLFPYFVDYRRNYVRRDVAPERPAGEAAPGGLDFDVVTEITLADRAGYDRLVRDMADPAIRRQVVEDEERFMDRAATVVLVVDEERSAIAPAMADRSQ